MKLYLLISFVSYLTIIIIPANSNPQGNGLEGTDKSETITGLIFCDNWFEFWFNGELVATDPVVLNPHQAVRVSFKWDGVSDKTYAIRCQDYTTDIGYKYVNSTDPGLPALGIGSFIAHFSDGTYTNSSWSVFTEVSGPTPQSIGKGCSKNNPYVCELKKNKQPLNWVSPSFVEDSSWQHAIEHPSEEINWGGNPPLWIEGKGCCYSQSLSTNENLTTNDGCSVNPDDDFPDAGRAVHVAKHECVNPWDHFQKNGQPKFIWAKNVVTDFVNLFRFTIKHL